MDSPHLGRAEVSLRVPADGAYVSVLRTMTAGLAARLDFTVDDIEDLRIAVGEACALVLPQARPGGDLAAEFRQTPSTLEVSVRVETEGRAELDYESFAWQVLTTLADEATADAGERHLEVRFSSDSSLALPETSR
ncbi:MAG TPA: ATP-binding protein [Nocardioides sp.]|jgi:serine/threonine-protein kinase RsbW|uniref:ATP-binding protein n=1 Tax=Nocardioides sp. TaxID=35761 RepID=UPI002E2EF1B0|nr:ATP-binding protein [Nocardioides sp.]HEX3931839.1 ATP-binding protein [Nocardioides sp.]